METNQNLSHRSGKIWGDYPFLSIFAVSVAFFLLCCVVASVVLIASEREDKALKAKTERCAQCVVSVLNSAQAAGVNLQDEGGVTNSQSAVEVAMKGVEPMRGPFAGKKFAVGQLNDGVTVGAVASLIRVEKSRDGAGLIIQYISPHEPYQYQQ